MSKAHLRVNELRRGQSRPLAQGRDIQFCQRFFKHFLGGLEKSQKDGSTHPLPGQLTTRCCLVSNAKVGGCFRCSIGAPQATFGNNIGISTNDDMLAWILMQVFSVLKMPNSQAAILFQDVSPALMIYV